MHQRLIRGTFLMEEVRQRLNIIIIPITLMARCSASALS